jgi:hypothetical protein
MKLLIIKFALFKYYLSELEVQKCQLRYPNDDSVFLLGVLYRTGFRVFRNIPSLYCSVKLERVLKTTEYKEFTKLTYR